MVNKVSRTIFDAVQKVVIFTRAKFMLLCHFRTMKTYNVAGKYIAETKSYMQINPHLAQTIAMH